MGVADCEQSCLLDTEPQTVCPTDSCFSDSDLYSVLDCGMELTGDVCGHRVYGDFAVGECESNHEVYTICQSSADNPAACQSSGIFSTTDCAGRVQKLILEGQCAPEGNFDSSMCVAGRDGSGDLCR